MKENIRVNYDDQLNDVADAFAAVIRKMGAKVTILDDEDGPWIDYEIEIHPHNCIPGSHD